jgi:hypothetical protein
MSTRGEDAAIEEMDSRADKRLTSTRVCSTFHKHASQMRLQRLK